MKQSILRHVKKKETKLSTFDILIIAMTLELQKIHGTDNITLLACDKRILKIAGLLSIKTVLSVTLKKHAQNYSKITVSKTLSLILGS